MSTLSNIRSSIQLGSLPVPLSQIFYGLTNTVDVTHTPFVTLTDFRSRPEYDTCGKIIATSTFVLHVLANSLELAESLALAIDAQIDTSKITPTTMALFQQSYEVLTEDLYVFHVAITYELQETI